MEVTAEVNALSEIKRYGFFVLPTCALRLTTLILYLPSTAAALLFLRPQILNRT